MNFKIKINNEEDYKKIKEVADYYSDLTQVVEANINEESPLFKIALSYVTEEDKKVVSSNKKIKCTRIGKEFFLESNNKELAFLFDKYPSNGKIKIPTKKFNILYALYVADKIEFDESFKKMFTPIETCDQSLFWTTRVNYRKKYFRLCDNYDRLSINKPDCKIDSMSLFKTPVPHTHWKVVNATVIVYSGKKCTVRIGDNVHICEMRGFPFTFNKEIWGEGNTVKIAVKNLTPSLYNPTIVPACLGIENEGEWNDFIRNADMLVSRTIPTELYNKFYFEVKLRKVMWS